MTRTLTFLLAMTIGHTLVVAQFPGTRADYAKVAEAYGNILSANRPIDNQMIEKEAPALFQLTDTSGNKLDSVTEVRHLLIGQAVLENNGQSKPKGDQHGMWHLMPIRLKDQYVRLNKNFRKFDIKHVDHPDSAHLTLRVMDNDTRERKVTTVVEFLRDWKGGPDGSEEANTAAYPGVVMRYAKLAKFFDERGITPIFH